MGFWLGGVRTGVSLSVSIKSFNNSDEDVEQSDLVSLLSWKDVDVDQVVRESVSSVSYVAMISKLSLMDHKMSHY